MNVDAKNLKSVNNVSLCHFACEDGALIGLGDQNQVSAGGVVVDWVEIVVLFNWQFIIICN